MVLTSEDRQFLISKGYYSMSDLPLDYNIMLNEVIKPESLVKYEIEILFAEWKDHTTKLGYKVFSILKKLTDKYGIIINDEIMLQVFKKAKEDFNKPLAICPECKSEYTSYISENVNMCDSCNNSFYVECN